MLFGRFNLGTVIWLALAMWVTEASSLENDINTKLAAITEKLELMSDQLLKVSEDQTRLSKQSAEKHNDQLTELTERVKTLEGETPDDDVKTDVINQIKELERKISETSSGPVFVRWDRKTCNGTGSEIVYTGVAGGSPEVDVGGGADLLCLPRDPSYANHDSTTALRSYILVAEYKLDPATNYPFENNDPLLLDEDVPCAVCQITNSSSVMMIPARVDCYSGWKLEYRGYLMTEELNKYRIQYVCVDDNPEVDYGGGASATYSVGLYPVETHCNYLPCPRFEHLAETACAVCSK